MIFKKSPVVPLLDPYRTNTPPPRKEPVILLSKEWNPNNKVKLEWKVGSNHVELTAVSDYASDVKVRLAADDAEELIDALTIALRDVRAPSNTNTPDGSNG